MMNFPWHFRMAFQQLFITSDETQKYFSEKITEISDSKEDIIPLV